MNDVDKGNGDGSDSDSVSEIQNTDDYVTNVLLQGDCKTIIDQMDQSSVPRKQRRYHDETMELIDRIRKTVSSVPQQQQHCIAFRFEHIPRDKTLFVIYSVDFDVQSKATTTVEGSDKTSNSSLPPIADPYVIVLLLMTPITRRFEPLQLEFDTKKAIVADIIQQIPISTTEESLRTQTFDCVCEADGN